jgi:poly-beta-1,6-N-acetyl-D-glucosamine synthase
MSRVLLITPARDEAEFLTATIGAVAAQTRPPDLWLVVDDGSTDETPEILARHAAELPFMKVIQAPTVELEANHDRLTVAAEARAFNAGLAAVAMTGLTHIGKLDADVELPPDYLERLLERFAEEPELGIAGGTLLEQNGGQEWRPAKVPAHHVRGALKLYSRECFEAIGGIEERLGWDTIDETYARMRGYSTRSLPDLTARHHRPVGSRGGALRGRARHGQCAYILGYAPWWVLLRSFKVGCSRPFGLTGAAFLYGYARSAARREGRVEDEEFRRFVARELRGRVRPGSDANALVPARAEVAEVPTFFMRS